MMLRLDRFSFGVGDRFAHQASAQLSAFQKLERDGVVAIPVWNKSNREHSFIGSEPSSVRRAAIRAIEELGWKHAWHVDADHIRLETVDRFLDSSDFFTIDVADSIGVQASESDAAAFLQRHPELIGRITIDGIEQPLELTREKVSQIVGKYFAAAQEAGTIYRHIESKKGTAGFIAEVSMDETDSPQTPQELFVILAALADQGVQLQTIAPKFTGRFNKGVDYVGDLTQFEKEFRDDLSVIAHCVNQYGLPSNLKLSVHSGSDKFSIYPIIRRALADTHAGLHIKTAGTTWLEELIGLSEAGGDGLQLVNDIYAVALDQIDALSAPYASVIDIDPIKLPTKQSARGWTGKQWADALRHVPNHPDFNASLRQLLHVSFKLAAKEGTRFTDLLKANRDIVAKNVSDNIYLRHMRPLFLPS
jgi:hypothetical protein